MQIDFKYILRYGMPGWFLCITLIINFCLINNIGFISLASAEYAAILTTVVGLLVFGVPIGYILNRIGLYLWTKKVKEEEYFEAEMIFHEIMEKNKYLEERYRYLLSTLHGAQTLCIAAAFAFLLNLAVTSYGYFLMQDVFENGYTVVTETTIKEESIDRRTSREENTAAEIVDSLTREETESVPVAEIRMLTDTEKKIKDLLMGVSVIFCLVLFSAVFIFYITAEYNERNLDYFIKSKFLKTSPGYTNQTFIQKIGAFRDQSFSSLASLFKK